MSTTTGGNDQHLQTIVYTDRRFKSSQSRSKVRWVLECYCWAQMHNAREHSRGYSVAVSCSNAQYSGSIHRSLARDPRADLPKMDSNTRCSSTRTLLQSTSIFSTYIRTCGCPNAPATLLAHIMLNRAQTSLLNVSALHRCMLQCLLAAPGWCRSCSRHRPQSFAVSDYPVGSAQHG
jgi:hypothetical protein